MSSCPLPPSLPPSKKIIWPGILFDSLVIQHTRYITSGILRLKKSDLDGACSDTRFDEDFFIDLIFAPLNSTKGSDPPKGLQTVQEANCEQKDLPGHGVITKLEKKDVDIDTEESKNESRETLERKKDIPPVFCEHSESDSAKPSDSGLTMSSALTTEYEQQEQAESMFWDAVALRQRRCKRRDSRKFECKSRGQFSIGDEFSLSRSNDSESKQDATYQLHNSACLDRSNPGNT